MPGYYPPVGFHFRVDVVDLPSSAHDIRFTEVSGLSVELGGEEVAEGGENRFAQRYPTRAKYPELVLKRGITKGDNEFFKWLSTVKLNTVERRNLVISLLNEEHQPVMVWKIMNAFPVKVEGPQLKAAGNEVAIETIEVAHEGLELQNE